MGHCDWIVTFLVLFHLIFRFVIAITICDRIHNACEHVRYPDLCIKTLSGSVSGGEEYVDFAALLLNKTITHTNVPIFEHEKLDSRLVSSQTLPKSLHAIGYCEQLMRMSKQRLHQSMAALKESPAKKKHDIQTWLSAAMTFQQACKDSADQHENSARISETMEQQIQLASNTLAFINRIEAGDSAKHQTSDSKAGLWTAAAAVDKKMADVVVAKDGTGNYRTVSEAIAAARMVPGRRFVLYVKAGVYKEKIQTSKQGITLIGDGMYNSVISWGDSVGGGSSLQGSATFAITGDDFMAKDIGFENTAGPESDQAVALLVSSDRSVFYRCRISGHQDTLYAFALRQFYRECEISGTIDFIFGFAAAVFQSSNLILRRPRAAGYYNVILASGRFDPAQKTGLTLQNCKISVGPDLYPVRNSFESYLGRPWKPYARAAVMETEIDGAISERGWIEWPGSSLSSLGDLYFGEYKNVGPRAGLSGRVGWPGFHAMGSADAEKFTVAELIAGDSWLPSTGVNFNSSL